MSCLLRTARLSARLLFASTAAPCRRASRFNVPPSAEFVARPVGVCSMLRLPVQTSAEGLDAAFVGVPLDTGTSNRPGARFGPQQIRAESVMVRRYNASTGAAPFDSLLVADVGDVNVNLYNLPDSCRRIRESYQKIVASGCVPLTLGGDHSITYPILQAVAEKHGPVGLVHVDAHTDTSDMALGEKIYHGTPFRRCVDEGLLDCSRVVQIGIRGSSYAPNPYKYCWDQALEIIRGCKGLNIVGCDLVEVAPIYDVSAAGGHPSQTWFCKDIRAQPQRLILTQCLQFLSNFLPHGLDVDAAEAPVRGDFNESTGTRREQARQLVIDLETRGKQAFPIFLSILRDTGHGDLADMLDEGCGSPMSPPVDLRPVQLELPGDRRDKSVSTAERLSIPVQPESERFRMPPAPAQGSAVDKSDHRLVYQLRADPCGHCLIFNNVSFSRDSDLSTRAGSDIDCEKLEKRFRSLCFHVRTLRNLKAQEIDVELRKLARLDHSALDCCLVVILSHGCQTSHIQFPGGIYGTDGKIIPIERIVNYFNGSQCPSLRGKPKLFFIQACGGEQKDQGFEVDCESPQDETCRRSIESDAIPFQAPSGNEDEPDAVASLPTPGDILVSYSTFPGFVSWRDKVSGSWYVETLDSVLEHYARSEDLLTMLLRVSDIVSTKGRYKQIPGCFNFLRKKFFFLCK